MVAINYKPDGEVLKAYMKSDKFVRGIRGPIGSGTSTASCIELFRRACAQQPDENGTRYYRHDERATSTERQKSSHHCTRCC